MRRPNVISTRVYKRRRRWNDEWWSEWQSKKIIIQSPLIRSVKIRLEIGDITRKGVVWKEKLDEWHRKKGPIQPVRIRNKAFAWLSGFLLYDLDGCPPCWRPSVFFAGFSPSYDFCCAPIFVLKRVPHTGATMSSSLAYFLNNMDGWIFWECPWPGPALRQNLTDSRCIRDPFLKFRVLLPSWWWFLRSGAIPFWTFWGLRCSINFLSFSDSVGASSDLYFDYFYFNPIVPCFHRLQPWV